MKDRDGIGFRLPYEEKQAVERVAQTRGVSTATIVREALRWYMTVLSTQNPTTTAASGAASETRESPWARVG